MVKVVAAVWQPESAALDWLRAEGAVVRHSLADQGRYGAGEPFDAYVTATVEDPHAIVSSDLGRRVWAWTVDERRPRVGPESCDVTMVALMRRTADLTHEEFLDHWTTNHTPLALRHHAALSDYTQNLVIDTLTAATDEIDGVAELGFRTREDFETGFYDSDDGRRAIGEDVRRFMAGPGPDTTLLAPPQL